MIYLKQKQLSKGNRVQEREGERRREREREVQRGRYKAGKKKV